MRKYLITSLTLALIAAGCGREEPPPPKDVPPPPTAQAIYNEFKAAAQPLWTQLNSKGISDSLLEPIPTALRGLKGRNTLQENGPEAIQKFQKELEKLVLDAKKIEDWRLTRFACYAHKAMQPNSERFDRLLEKTEIIAARPIVKIKGFFEPGGIGDEVNIMLTVTDPKTKMETDYSVKQGQNFHPAIDPNGRPINLLKAVRIVGKDALELEYLPISQLWTVSLRP